MEGELSRRTSGGWGAAEALHTEAIPPPRLQPSAVAHQRPFKVSHLEFEP